MSNLKEGPDGELLLIVSAVIFNGIVSAYEVAQLPTDYSPISEESVDAAETLIETVKKRIKQREKQNESK